MPMKESINYTLTENALDFIQEAITMYKTARKTPRNRKKNIKYSVLNLNSGIELLIKQRLYSENWAYCVADIDKITKDAFLLGDFNSVKTDQATKRLKNLCGVSLTEKEIQDLNLLRKTRNQIEHFNINNTVEALQTMVLMGLSFAIRFISKNLDHLKLQKKENEILDKIKFESQEIEKLQLARVELITQHAQHEGIIDSLITCPKCLKKFYHLDDNHNNCLFCYHCASSEELTYSYITNELGITEYTCVKDGEEWPQYECIYCGQDKMVRMKDGNYYCFDCGEHIKMQEVMFCVRCGRPYSSKDEFEICGTCWTEFYLNNFDEDDLKK